MTDIQKTPLAVTDFDAGESWAPETITLARPFKLHATVYDVATIRLPTGLDIELHIHGQNVIAEMRALAVALTGWPDAAFQKMHAGDRQRIMAAVGEHMAGAR